MKQFFLLPLVGLALTVQAQNFPYQDKSLSAQERAADLVSRMTIREKVSLMSDGSPEVKRVGIKRYNWWNEALHGVGRAGMATVLPQPIGMAATFDPDLLLQAYTAVSDEARAKHAQSASQGSYARYQGLTFWTPTVNILRDPRWGRGIETYGEDPYLASVMGVAVVKGLQGPEGEKYDKLHACAKHFAVHSGPEWNRHSFNAENISIRELYETYLPPFKALVQDAKVKEVMCAYNAFEGDPCCGSDRLLTQILRNQWGFEGIVVSDCGAIDDFYNGRGHHTHADKASAAAAAVISGTDLDCGGTYGALTDALKQGHITEEQINVSLTRLMKARFELGEMDDLQDVSWAQIPASVVASDEHDALALQLAREGMTLLTNKDGILPLKRGSGLTVAVVGPNANDSVMQWGNYNGTPRRTITALEGIRRALGKNDRLIYVKGCDRVERTLLESTFNDCQIDGQVGFRATYWNNKKFEGQPAATVHCSTPMQLCTSGATVFAPGVNLTNFTATYESTFTPQKDGEVNLDFYYCGKITILVDGQEVKSFRTNHGSRAGGHKMKVNAGQAYALQFNFEYSMGDAQLNFDLGFKEDVNIAQAVDEAKKADVIVFVGGISPSLEGEEMGVNLPGFKRGDRTEIELPDIQREMIQALCQTGKPVVYVNCSGSAIAMVPEVERCAAVLQAWYPGQSGGQALAEVLFGDYNPSGRLPLTIYKSLAQLPDFEDYNMAGRTYRYMTQEPLFPFGYGLSYSTFSYGTPALSSAKVMADEANAHLAKGSEAAATPMVTLTVPVTNTSSVDGDEIVQVYLRKPSDSEGPLKTLRAFQRVHVPAGKTVSVSLPLTASQLEWWDNGTNTLRVTAGQYDLLVGSSSRDADLQAVSLTVK